MYLGIDLGTSSVKVLLIDARPDDHWLGEQRISTCRGRIPAGRSRTLPTGLPPPRQAIAALKAHRPAELAAVRGIGLSGHMHGATILDEGDEVLRPCILWNDTRSHAEAAELDADPRFRQVTGNIVFPGFTAPKLAWVRKNEPDIFAKVRWVLLPKDYLRLWLTGEHMSEMSDSAGTSWLDVGARRWSAELLAATELSERQMPTLVEGSEPGGQAARRARRPLGHGEGHRRGRRSRRQCGVRLRHGHGTAGPGLRFARHIGRDLCRQWLLSAEPAKRGAHILPCAAEHLASDGRHPVGDGFAELAFRRHRQERRPN